MELRDLGDCRPATEHDLADSGPAAPLGGGLYETSTGGMAPTLPRSDCYDFASLFKATPKVLARHWRIALGWIARLTALDDYWAEYRLRWSARHLLRRPSRPM